MTISDFITQTMPQLLSAAIASNTNYPSTAIYNYLKEIAVNMLQDGHLEADDQFISALAIKRIEAHNGYITVQELCQEMNALLMPGNRVNWQKIVIELNLGPYTVTENDAYFEGDERRYKIKKSHDYDYCYNYEKQTDTLRK